MMRRSLSGSAPALLLAACTLAGCGDRPSAHRRNFLLEAVVAPGRQDGQSSTKATSAITMDCPNVALALRSLPRGSGARRRAEVFSMLRPAARLQCAGERQAWIREVELNLAGRRDKESADHGLDILDGYETVIGRDDVTQRLRGSLEQRVVENIASYERSMKRNLSCDVEIGPPDEDRGHNIFVRCFPKEGLKAAFDTGDPIVLMPLFVMVAEIGQSTTNSGFRSRMIVLDMPNTSFPRFVFDTPCARKVAAAVRRRDPVQAARRFRECAKVAAQ